MDPRVVATSHDEVTVIHMQRALSPSGEPLDSPVVGLYEVVTARSRAQMFHFDTAGILALPRARRRMNVPLI